VEDHLTATVCHSPYGITQCYLPPDTSEHTPALTPARHAGTRFTHPGGMEGWVDLVEWLHTEMVYPPAGGHPSNSKYTNPAEHAAENWTRNLLITSPTPVGLPSHPKAKRIFRFPRKACIPRTARATIGDRAFPSAAASVWNSLPESVRGSPTLPVFRNRLKTELFARSFS